jgi:hypothetical protein
MFIIQPKNNHKQDKNVIPVRYNCPCIQLIKQYVMKVYLLNRGLGGPHGRSGRYGEVKIFALTGARTPISWSEPGAGRTSRAEKGVGKKYKAKARGKKKEPECFLLIGLCETETILCNKKVFPCYDLNLVPQMEGT